MSSNSQEQNGSSAQSYDIADDYADFAHEKGQGETSLNNRERARARQYRPAYEKSARKPAAEREDSFNALAWLIEGATGMVEELRHNDLGLTEEFWVHAAAARREGLLAARAVLEQLLEETQQQQTAQRERESRQARRGDINVDF